MKSIFSLVALVLVAGMSTVFADTAHPRPKSLVCAAPEANDEARKFTIERFDTDKPGATNDAADSDGVTVDGTTTQLCANNGCDNSYCYVFFTDDVTALALGKVKVIRGMMNYLNSSSKEGSELAETVSLRCAAGK